MADMTTPTDDRAQRGGVFQPTFEVAAGTDTNRFRRARFKGFLALLEAAATERATVRVADIGGSAGLWLANRDLWGHLTLEITIINIGADPIDQPPFFVRGGDACDLSEHADMSFDVVHSNSVIEHVGHWREMRRMAGEVRRLAPHYWVQTPNFGFPYEPHYKTLFIHWLPEPWRARLITRRKIGWVGAETFDQAMTEVQDIQLLTARQMATLFPDAEIRRERIGPFAKSLIAVR